jgi:hypothetical protein
VRTLAALQYPDDLDATDVTLLDIEKLADADADRYAKAAVVVREVMEGGLSTHLNEALFQFESLLVQLNEARERHGVFATSRSFGTRWNRTCLYALFAFASGVYSYKEQVEAEARRLSNSDTALPAVKAVFSEARAQCPEYALVHQLRNVMVHRTMQVAYMDLGADHLLPIGRDPAVVRLHLQNLDALPAGELHSNAKEFVDAMTSDEDVYPLLQATREQVAAINHRVLPWTHPAFPVSADALRELDARFGDISGERVIAEYSPELVGGRGDGEIGVTVFEEALFEYVFDLS